MIEDRLAELLARRQRLTEPSAECPSDDLVASYLDGTLEPDARRRFEEHVAHCARCTELIGAVMRSEALATDSADELLVARAFQLVSRRSRFRAASLWASAATLLLGIGLVATLGLPPQTTDDAPTVRGSRLVDRGAEVPKITVPSERTSIEPEHLAVSWSAVPAARYYEVRVLDDDGDVVTVQRVTGTEWNAAGTVDLRAGADYYVRVDAFAEDNRPRSSEHVLFHVAEQN
jgi:hypothetical protein